MLWLGRYPCYCVHLVVFVVAIIVFAYFMITMRPTLVRRKDLNSIKTQVVERKK